MKIPVVSTTITTAEIPGKIAIAVELGGCLQGCKGCHSPHLSAPVADPMTGMSFSGFLTKALQMYPEVNAVVFMGGTCNLNFSLSDLKELIEAMHEIFKIDFGVYSGNPNDDLDYFLGIQGLRWFKTGNYVEELGGLENPKTNQRFYEKEIVIETDSSGVYAGSRYQWKDITAQFQQSAHIQEKGECYC